MRTIQSAVIADVVADMVAKANLQLPGDVLSSIQKAKEEETWSVARQVLEQILINDTQNGCFALCQDTGTANIYVELGQDVHIEGNFEEAINEGVARGYKDAYLRKSMVRDPLRRVNTTDNTPAMIHVHLVPGDGFHLMVAPKGQGCENMSALAMLRPADGYQGVIDFVVRTVEKAGSNPCPPIVVGVGIGGTFDKVAEIAKKALFRDLGDENPDPFYANMEKELLEKINSLGIGPQGFGGKCTALAVKVDALPTHIAGLPVAVCINCHVSRHIERDL